MHHAYGIYRAGRTFRPAFFVNNAPNGAMRRRNRVMDGLHRPRRKFNRLHPYVGAPATCWAGGLPASGILVLTSNREWVIHNKKT